ncbi:hypothetical protein SO802_030132 [Lithocarpus litseifolius]|uniref:Uncharacterized protein n=1 Tax=Lithocarpus litseifolius TaxID=425828 RepID=A0AAW2BWR6_9ROSI
MGFSDTRYCIARGIQTSNTHGFVLCIFWVGSDCVVVSDLSVKKWRRAEQDAKICFSDDTLPDGYNVNKEDMVAYQPYAMGKMKFIWGDDTEECKPERWLNEEGIFQPESPFKFTAF